MGEKQQDDYIHIARKTKFRFLIISSGFSQGLLPPDNFGLEKDKEIRSILEVLSRVDMERNMDSLFYAAYLFICYNQKIEKCLGNDDDRFWVGGCTSFVINGAIDYR